MTVLMTIIGVFVFVISLFTTTFKDAVKRLIAFALIGVFIDIMLINLGAFATYYAFN